MRDAPAKKRVSTQARADMLVPAVQRVAIVTGDGQTLRSAIAEQDQWDDPDDKSDRGKTKRQVLGYRRRDPLVTLNRKGDDVTAGHLRAASRLRDDYEIGEGAKPGYERPEPGTGSSGGLGASELQFVALQNYRNALQAVGQRLSAILIDVVLVGNDPGSYAERHGMSRNKIVGYLCAALDRLQDFYELGPAQRYQGRRAPTET